MLKTNPLLLETYNTLLSNHKGDSLAPEAGKNQKMAKIVKKIEKTAKISIILRVCL